MIARASAVLLAAGALAGTLAGWGLPPRAPAHHGEFFVLAGDFHVHGFPGDGALPAWALRNEARRRGLDVMAFTNHNQRLAGRIGRMISGDTATPLVLRGEEITAAHYHIAAVGVEQAIPGTLPAAEAIAAVHAQGGVAIAAHPSALFWRGFDAAAKASLDGAEIAHPMIIGDPIARAQLIAFTRSTRELNPHVAPIGSTDFHFRQPLGLCRTYVFAREYSEAGVLEAIRAGRTVAFDPDGGAYGDPELAAAVDHVRAAAQPLAFWRRTADGFSGVLGMVGLLGLIAFRIT
jgi:predicted metal-dependent phosphoesterase TrpH